MLKIDNIFVSYGLINVIKGVSLDIKKGSIVSLIGSNGAGKTTILHTISGLLKVKEGSIILDGIDISKVSADKIVKMGLIQVPEGRRIFLEQTVEENLLLGAYIRNEINGIRDDLEYIYSKFVRLKERRKQLAQTLSGGEQQMLAIARALMGRPKILLLDEPSMGLAPILVNEVFNIIEDIKRDGVTILLIEQNAKKALEIADYSYVLETGIIKFEGCAKDLLNLDKLKEAYLGDSL